MPTDVITRHKEKRRRARNGKKWVKQAGENKAQRGSDWRFLAESSEEQRALTGAAQQAVALQAAHTPLRETGLTWRTGLLGLERLH